MLHKIFRCSASLFFALALSFSSSIPAAAAAPVNDNFADALAIPSLPFNISAETAEATTEFNEPQACGSASGSVWYSFSPTQNMAIQVDLAGSAVRGHANIYVASGSSFSDLTYLGCAKNGFSTSTANFQAQAGKTYYLQIESESGLVGIIQVNLAQITPPANDNFAAAQPIQALPFNATVDNVNATTEPGEPLCFFSPLRTVWYSFSPVENMLARLSMPGGFASGSVNFYVASGPAISDLTLLGCVTTISSADFNLEAGKTYYLQVSADEVGPGLLQVNLEQILPPANDHFAEADPILSLPFRSTVDTTLGTLDLDEPIPFCGLGETNRTIWYAFTPSSAGSVTASLPASGFSPIFAAYTGSTLTGLTEIGCTIDGNLLTFHVDAGTVYYVQVGNLNPLEPGGSVQFLLDIAAEPVLGFYFDPSNPTDFDNVLFCDASQDPAAAGFQSFTWDFGDGATSTENCAYHQYQVDGDYTVQHSATTIDGRIASGSQVVQVRTHDISVTKVIAPRFAKAGRTRTITVFLRNARYPEDVQIDLYRSVPGGFELVASSIESVPVRKGSRTTQFNLRYTFTLEDAQARRVTFKAVVTLLNANDAVPADNEAVSSRPTIVRR